MPSPTEGPGVLVTGDATASSRALRHLFGRATVRALWAVAILFLVGSLVDLGLLWVIQRQPDNPVWEFYALANTVEGTPRIVLAAALIWLALHIRGSGSIAAQRILAAIFILLGFAGAIAGGMAASDYFVLRGNVGPDQNRLFMSVVIKTLILSALHIFILLPIGVLALRRSRD